jgi:hypothetical protein
METARSLAHKPDHAKKERERRHSIDDAYSICPPMNDGE